MLEVKVILESAVEEILGFRCCQIPDQNVEIHVRNRGDRTWFPATHFLLEGEQGTLRVENLFPPWEQGIEPGETGALYCSMDTKAWERARTLVLFDRQGRAWRFPVAELL